MTGSTLADLQTNLQHYLLDQQNDAYSLTLETAAFTRQQRLDIYYDAYRLRLIDALRNDFPAVEATLGAIEFIQVMDEYIALNPSRHPSLRWLGEKLPTFLRNHASSPQRPVVCELAAFEWAQIMAFDAEDYSPATLDDLRSLENTQWLTLQLVFQASLQLEHYFTNAPEIWSALVKDAAAIEEQKSAEAQTWAIWRSELQVVFRPMDKPEAWCMQLFMQNKNFSNICEGLCEWFPADQVPMKAAQYLQQWLQAGLIKHIV